MRTGLIGAVLLLGSIWPVGQPGADESREREPAAAARAGPRPVPTPESARPGIDDRVRRNAEIVRKNIFLPAVPEEPEPPATEPRQTAEAPVPTTPPPPDTAPAERPEDFMILTGIMEVDGERQVLIENRRTHQSMFLKKGAALGEGVIIDIAKYHVTLKEWTVSRDIPLGYTVSGKKDTYKPPPVTPTVASVSSGGTSNGGGTRLPRWPGRSAWNQWTPEQQRDYLRRRREAWRRIREQRDRQRREREARERQGSRR